MLCPHCKHEIECPDCIKRTRQLQKGAKKTNQNYTKEKRKKAALKAWKTKKKSL